MSVAKVMARQWLDCHGLDIQTTQADKIEFKMKSSATTRRQGPVTDEWIDQRSLAMHTEMTQMIRAKPELLDVPKATLARWIKKDNPPSSALLEWDTILKDSTTEEVLSLLTRWDEEARQLRQSSPFCGILPEERRLAIFAEFEQRLLVRTSASTKSAKPTIGNSPAPLVSEVEYLLKA